ncbi:DUF1330 domain-containing protein [Blastomonas sp.]|uniref:DUF1330 domain-containing protein n=1 Tax=Blastomonas sp. TaxID=1909299 RepID=UPI002630FF8F|nr:DUF1330 domain-containing protein [Blastomonas sp.]MDM7956682.1 DUF1330 domain-containing protein [Blastomonas sp.]
MSDAPTYLDVTQTAGRDFMMRGITGPVVMLNLLRFRPEANYSATPDLAPDQPISGREAFLRYVKHTLPFLHASGGSVEYLGDGGAWLIGPASERWDAVMLIRQASVEAFIAWNSDAAYLAGIGHRTAALEDSRLLPTTALTFGKD